MAGADRLRIRVIRLAAGAVAAGVVGGWMLQTGLREPELPSPTNEALSAPVQASRVDEPLSGPPVSGPTAVAAGLAAPPIALSIPALAVSAEIDEVGLTAAGDLDVPPPSRPHEAGWYVGSPPPGDPGRAVVIGHVDTADGIGVFYRLATLQPADKVEVSRADGRVATFSVDGIRVHAREAFPAQAIFAPSNRAELVLVTCGGSFDSTSGYSSTVLVYAHLTDISDPAGDGGPADERTEASRDAAARVGANLLVLVLSAGVLFAFWKARTRRRRLPSMTQLVIRGGRWASMPSDHHGS